MIAARWARRGQSGELLMETLLTLLLVAVVLPAVLLLATTITVSAATHRDAVDARNVATTLAESIDLMEYAADCDPLATYRPQLPPIPAGYTEPQLTVRFLAPTDPAEPSVQFQDGCVAAGDEGLQEITVRVTADDQRGAGGSVTIVKRNDDCPAGAPILQGQRC